MDCKDYIQDLKRNNIQADLILTDPPYNLSRPNNFHTLGKCRLGIDFGKWDKGFNQTEWINGLFDIVKKGGSVLIFNSWLNIGNVARKLEQEGFVIKDLIRWIKKNPMPRNIERRYISDYEFIIWAVKPGAKWVFNRNKEYKYMRPHFKFGSVRKRIHPTQKPVILLKELIKIHTNENDLVIDLFAGSGSTFIAALETNRKYMGCEIDQKFFMDTIKRLEKKIDDLRKTRNT